MSTVAEVIGTIVARLGVGHAFGVVGSGNFHVTNALRAGGVPFVAARHEAGAATMADAYARTSGDVAVLSLHQGCGLTNALTGIAEAAKSRTPLLVLAADTAGAAVRSNFRIDQDAAVRAVGAVPERVHTAGIGRRRRRAGVRHLRAAAAHGGAQPAARRPGRPVRAARPAADGGAVGRRRGPDQASVAALAALLDGAERPVFIAGRGARHARPGAWRRWPSGAARCWPPRRWRTGCSRATPWSLGISGGFATAAGRRADHRRRSRRRRGARR